MPNTIDRRELKATARARTRTGNKLANALKDIPLSVKREWATALKDDAFCGFRSLLTGSTHICPECGHDAGPRNPKTDMVYACGCDRPHPAAVRAYLELTGDVGPANTVMVNLVQQMGVRDEGQLVRYVEGGRRLEALSESVTPEMLEADAVEVLRDALKATPERRDAIREALGL